jgi:hypothetical protein
MQLFKEGKIEIDLLIGWTEKNPTAEPAMPQADSTEPENKTSFGA